MLGGNKYRIAVDDLVPRGKRAWSRLVKKSDTTDPGVIKTARWKVHGPIGLSREQPDGELGPDYTDDLDSRNEYLLTSTPKRNAVTLTQPASP
ncbi:MAG TPA: hypothetical protein VGA36_10835, partial [Nitriliruptorales bacterium]